jgi:RNA polymerase sigma factor (TIGR02999 family)
MSEPGDVTHALRRLQDAPDDRQARAGLYELVKNELERQAHGLGRGRPADPLLQTGDLVHEAFLRLLGRDHAVVWSGRRHFFCAAAKVMRHLRVDRARRRHAVRLGDAVPADSRQRPPEERLQEQELLLRLHAALDDLAREDPRAAEVAELRLFGGSGPRRPGEPPAAQEGDLMPMRAVVEVLGHSPATAYRAWQRACDFLQARLGLLPTTEGRR